MGTCDGITSVFRVQADSCGRLWVLDSGQIHITIEPKQVCHPQILIFDLKTDRLLTRYVLPGEFVKEDGLFSNILVDIRGDDCVNVHAYLTDVWRFNLVVFSLEKMRSWLVSDHLFYPDPLAAAYKLHHLEFNWMDGLFGLSLSPYSKYLPDRILYFHPMSSFRGVLCTNVSQSRGPSGHVSSSWMDRNGIMFFNLVTRDSIGCWDTRKPYKRENLGVVAKSRKTLVFPNDVKVDQEPRQSIWIISNWLPYYLHEGLSENKINFRIMRAYTDEAIKNTICDPLVRKHDSYIPHSDETDCY
ncbi:hypothetical protein NQ317_005557 [Molorchus minor]|uniref:Yellow-h2 n=1 Tax=Molorchus minor TaxID=1323400 RepID=A0ABQ9JY85_9CUCU|nr:hypothetical protein NQ317_005557 [Molorchus minor]